MCVPDEGRGRSYECGIGRSVLVGVVVHDTGVEVCAGDEASPEDRVPDT